MATSVIFEEQVEVPLDVATLADFRRWAHSGSFPERGRIDYLAGRIEVDMSPEDLFCHGTLKTELVVSLGLLVRNSDAGDLFTDSTRVSSDDAGLSVEPDVVFISHDSLATGRVKLVPI